MKIKSIIFSCIFTFDILLGQQIIIFSIPKAGSHLLAKILFNLTGKERTAFSASFELDNNKACVGHISYNQYWVDLIQEHGWRPIFIYRDPRDQLISKAHWIRNAECDHYPDIMLNCSLSQTVSYLIHNNFGVVNSELLYRSFMSWLDFPDVYSTCFERLVGLKGGGSDEAQFNEVRNIANHIGLQCSDDQIRQAISNVFGDTFTFRQGQIGAWKNEFTQEQKELFKTISGQLLIDLGYEKDLNW